MINLKKILLPTDFSENSEHALQYAREFTELFDAELHILHVSHQMALEHGMSFLPPGDLMLDMRPAAKRKLREIANDDWAAERTIVREMREGRPFVEIIRYADEVEIDLIIMGTHGWGPISHLLVGSVAERVVQKAHCPVMTIRPAGHEFVLP